MAKDTVDEAFHQIIKNVWQCLNAYNQEKTKDAIINGLTTIKEQIDTLIHHLKNS